MRFLQPILPTLQSWIPSRSRTRTTFKSLLAFPTKACLSFDVASNIFYLSHVFKLCWIWFCLLHRLAKKHTWFITSGPNQILQDSPVKPGPSKPEVDCGPGPSERDLGPSPSSEPFGPDPMAEPGHEPTQGADAGVCPSGPAPSVPAANAEHDVDLLKVEAPLMVIWGM